MEQKQEEVMHQHHHYRRTHRRARSHWKNSIVNGFCSLIQHTTEPVRYILAHSSIPNRSETVFCYDGGGSDGRNSGEHAQNESNSTSSANNQNEVISHSSSLASSCGENENMRQQRQRQRLQENDLTRIESFSVGVVSDVQYGKLSTRKSVSKVAIKRLQSKECKVIHVRRRRAWNESKGKLREACKKFNETDVDLVVNLGDTVQGYNRNDADQRRVLSDLNCVLSEFNCLNMPTYHVIGNHDRYISKNLLFSSLSLPSLSNGYYAREPCKEWKILFLNTAQICPSAVDAISTDLSVIRDIVHEDDRDFVKFHGAIDQDQLTWLSDQIDESKKTGQKVLIFSHYPLADHCARPTHVIANTKKVREVLEKDGTSVVLCVAGHDHLGGKYVLPATNKRNAITYVTLPAMLEAPENGNAYGIIRAYSDGTFEIEGNTDSSPINC